MKCTFCGQPATIHLTDIVQRQKREMHLCERCARERQLLPAPLGTPLNLKALLQFLLQALRCWDSQPERVCPHCGLTSRKLKTDGRIGCAHDYELFRNLLEPLLEQVHRGIEHVGKRPRADQLRQQLQQLRQCLQQAVAEEKYEDAAQLRDRIRQIERDVEGTCR
jgi:protein arginine kinase activator